MHSVCGCLYETHTHLHSIMRVVILLANTHKGQECHFVPHGCLLKVVRYVATGGEVKDNPGR